MNKSHHIPPLMMAVGLDENRRLITKQVPVPKPGKGEVLVKITAAPVNPSDLARIRNLPDDKTASFICGIEGSGVVVGYGKGLLPKLWQGKRVACSSSGVTSGSWAEYMAAPAMGCVPLPDVITDEQGSMLLVNPLTTVAFLKIIRKNNHKAVINTAAAGALGKIFNMLAAANNIPVIQVVRNQTQADKLISNGAACIVNSSSPDFERDLKALSHQFKATLALDAVGGAMTRQLLMAMPFSSSILVYGNLSGEQPVVDHRTLVDDQKNISGFYLVNWLKEQNMLTKLDCILKARKLLGKKITVPVQSRFPLDKAETAIETYLNNMTSGKVLLIPDYVV